MKSLKLLMAICLIGAAVACSRSSKDKFLGISDDTPSAHEGGTPDTNLAAAPAEEQLMNKVATEILAEITGTNGSSFAAPAALSGCTPGEVKFSSNTYTYPPAVHGSSRVYTVNGNIYFSAVNYRSSGGTLVYTTERNGTCLTNSSIYGNMSVSGRSYTQWTNASNQIKYWDFSYTYNYAYKGDLLIIDGSYTVGSDSGTTEYPVKWIINI